jgi:hypothetical protein
MASILALVSVLSGAAVAISVPWITSTLERKRLREQFGETRADELRSVLDQAAIALDKAVSRLPTHALLTQDDRNYVAVLAESRAALEDVGAQAERLAVRVGEASPIFTGYDQARSALWTSYRELISQAETRTMPVSENEIHLDPELEPCFVAGRSAFRAGAGAIVSVPSPMPTRWKGRGRSSS